jgi:hypothetical protein
MSNKTDLGIYLNDKKIFFYLEAGDNYIGNTVERVRKTLIQRNLIIPSIGNITDINYTVISIKEARIKDYLMQPIYISKHIKEMYENQTEVDSKFK